MKLFGKKSKSSKNIPQIREKNPPAPVVVDKGVDPFFALHGSLQEGVSWSAQEVLKEEIFRQLALAMKTGDVAGVEGQYLAQLHGTWLQMFWRSGMYSKEAHLTLANIYVADGRFGAFYDRRVGKGGAQFLRDAIEIYRYRGGAVLDLPQARLDRNSPRLEQKPLAIEELQHGIHALLSSGK